MRRILRKARGGKLVTGSITPRAIGKAGLADSLSLEDERAIGHVLLNYARGIDQRDWTLFAAVFTDDATIDYGDLGTRSGRASIVDYMETGHLKRGRTMHRISNIVIDGDDACASATSYIDAVLMPLHAGGNILQSCGIYYDKLVRSPAGWQIKYRIFENIRTVEFPETV